MKKLCFFALLSLVVAAGCSKNIIYLGPNRDVTADFDLLFAQELQRRGYVSDANHITIADVKDITELDVSGKGWDSDLHENVYGELTSLRGIEYFESLMVLRCHHNQLTSLNISKNMVLKEVWASYNQLPSLVVSKNLLLEIISCYNNQLTLLDVSKNPALKSLSCNTNLLTSLNVSKNSALEYLSCYSNRLTSLDVSKNPALEIFYCYSNPGDGAVFSVTAWFDNNSIPSDFTKWGWKYDGKYVQIDYRKAE